MNKAIPEIRERVEEFKVRLRRELRTRQKQRLQAVYLLKSGQSKSRTRAGELLGVSRRTVGEWLDRYAAKGLEGLLEIRTRSNRMYLLTPEQDARLREKLSEPEAFGSYTAAHAWVNATFGLGLDYKAVHQIVRYRHGAKLKVARKSHTKKGAAEAFKADLQRTLRGAVPEGGASRETPRPLRLFSQDESRFGLITVQRRRITRRGSNSSGSSSRSSRASTSTGRSSPPPGRASSERRTGATAPPSAST